MFFSYTGEYFLYTYKKFLICKSNGKASEIKPILIIHTLFFTVINGHTPCLRLLLEVADNPDVTDAKGQ